MRPNARFIGAPAQLRYQLPSPDISDHAAWVSTGNGNARCSMPPGLIQQRRRNDGRATSPSRCCAPTSSPAASRRDRASPRPSSPTRYGLGKAEIRRALVRLSERDWVQALSRRGYLVKPITLRDIGEIFELRRMIEPVAVAPRRRPHRRQPAAPARRGLRQRVRGRRHRQPGDLSAGAPPAASRGRDRRRQRAPRRRVRAAVGRDRARHPSHRADAQPRPPTCGTITRR